MKKLKQFLKLHWIFSFIFTLFSIILFALYFSINSITGISKLDSFILSYVETLTMPIAGPVTLGVMWWDNELSILIIYLSVLIPLIIIHCIAGYYLGFFLEKYAIKSRKKKVKK